MGSACAQVAINSVQQVSKGLVEAMACFMAFCLFFSVKTVIQPTLACLCRIFRISVWACGFKQQAGFGFAAADKREKEAQCVVLEGFVACGSLMQMAQELDLNCPSRNNSWFDGLGVIVRLGYLTKVPTRTDPFHPQRVTSRWVGNLRNTLVVPSTCSFSS
jgi:hypothetical protein